MQLFKYDIRFNTFFKKGLSKIDDRYGVYFVTGRLVRVQEKPIMQFIYLCNK